MDILDFFWTFYLNHLSPLWGLFFERVSFQKLHYVHMAGPMLQITFRLLSQEHFCNDKVGSYCSAVAKFD